jgi:hypothetical protein
MRVHYDDTHHLIFLRRTVRRRRRTRYVLFSAFGDLVEYRRTGGTRDGSAGRSFRQQVLGDSSWFVAILILGYEIFLVQQCAEADKLAGLPRDSPNTLQSLAAQLTSEAASHAMSTRRFFFFALLAAFLAVSLHVGALNQLSRSMRARAHSVTVAEPERAALRDDARLHSSVGHAIMYSGAALAVTSVVFTVISVRRREPARRSVVFGGFGLLLLAPVCAGMTMRPNT